VEGDSVVWHWAGKRAVAAGADQELVGISAEAKEIETIAGTYFILHTAILILLDARVIHGPMWESLVSAASLGFYLLYMFFRSVHDL
jgi:hypothetical protein